MNSSEFTFFYNLRNIYDPIGLFPVRIILGIDKRGVHFFPKDPKEYMYTAELRDIMKYGNSDTIVFFKIRVNSVFYAFIFETKQGEKICDTLRTHIHDVMLRWSSETNNVARIDCANGDTEKHVQDLSKAFEESERTAKQESLTKVDARENFIGIPRMLSHFYSVRKIDDPIGLLPDRIILGINRCGVHFFPPITREYLLSADLRDLKQYGVSNTTVVFKIRVEGVIHVFRFETKQGGEICHALQTHMRDFKQRQYSEARNVARIDSVNDDIATNSNPPTMDATEKVQDLSKALEESERTAKQKQKKEMNMQEEVEASIILRSESAKQTLEELSSKRNELRSLYEEQKRVLEAVLIEKQNMGVRLSQLSKGWLDNNTKKELVEITNQIQGELRMHSSELHASEETKKKLVCEIVLLEERISRLEKKKVDEDLEQERKTTKPQISELEKKVEDLNRELVVAEFKVAIKDVESSRLNLNHKELEDLI